MHSSGGFVGTSTKATQQRHENTENDHQGLVELTFIQILPSCNIRTKDKNTHFDTGD